MTVSLTDADNGKLSTSRLDVPMRAFAGGFYKNLISLYTHLGIPYKRKDFLYTFSNSSPSPSTYHLHPSNLHRPPPKPTGLSWLSHLLQLVLLYIMYSYFNICVFCVSPKTAPKSESLRDYLHRIHLPDFIKQKYLLPLFSAVSTCPHEALLDFPASDIIDYRCSVYAQPHYVVRHGVQAVQRRLLGGITIHFNRYVEEIEEIDGGLLVKWTGLESAQFDQVILAVNPAVVAKIYKPMRWQMSQIPCCEVEVVVHTDGSLLADLFPVAPCTDLENPPLRGSKHVHIKAAECLLGDTGADLIHLSTSTSSNGRAAKTQASHLHAPGVLITTQPHKPIPAEHILGETTFTRVLRTTKSREIVRSLVAGDGQGGVWVVGGWCWDGMVLLEGCVVSAARVARELGVDVPW